MLPPLPTLLLLLSLFTTVSTAAPATTAAPGSTADVLTSTYSAARLINSLYDLEASLFPPPLSPIHSPLPLPPNDNLHLNAVTGRKLTTPIPPPYINATTLLALADRHTPTLHKTLHLPSTGYLALYAK